MPEEPQPSLEWDGETIKVGLPMSSDGERVDASWKPTVVSVVRIRRVGETDWSPGFETPLNAVRFTGLKPNTEYEMQVTHKNASGEGPPATLKLLTNGQGVADGTPKKMGF